MESIEGFVISYNHVNKLFPLIQVSPYLYEVCVRLSAITSFINVLVFQIDTNNKILIFIFFHFSQLLDNTSIFLRERKHDEKAPENFIVFLAQVVLFFKLLQNVFMFHD